MCFATIEIPLKWEINLIEIIILKTWETKIIGILKSHKFCFGTFAEDYVLHIFFPSVWLFFPHITWNLTEKHPSLAMYNISKNHWDLLIF